MRLKNARCMNDHEKYLLDLRGYGVVKNALSTRLRKELAELKGQA